MASIQQLMARAQQQLQGMDALEASQPLLAQELKEKSVAHLDLLMQLAEAEQKHITGDLDSGQLQQVLDDLQQQLDQEQQEAMAAAASTSAPAATATAASAGPGSTGAAATGDSNKQRSSSGSSGSSSSGSSSGSSSNTGRVSASSGLQADAVQQKRSELLGSNEQLRAAVGRASAGLKQQQAAAVPADASKEQLQERIVVLQEQLEAADAALQDGQQLRMDYDRMCQQAYELSRKLSQADSAKGELQRALADARAQLAAAAEELSEHRELQMTHDKVCQDVYRMRMMLQQAQSHGNDVAQDAAATAGKHKQDVQWLMQDHRREVAEAHRKNQELIQDTQQLRMRLLELEQQLWGGAPAAAPAAAPDAEEQAAAAAALVVQQQEQLSLLQTATLQLTQEKQQLMKSLQRSNLIQQVQELEQSLQSAREAAAAAAAAAEAGRQQQRDAAAAVTPAPVSGAAADAGRVAEVKAEMVQLRGQLAATSALSALRNTELYSKSVEGAAAEAALQQQAAAYEDRLAQLQAWYGKQAVVAGQLRKGRRPAEGSVGFTNTNRFWVGQELVFEFLKHWVTRESQLQQQPGFLGLQVGDARPGVSADGGVDVLVASYWESAPLYEAWRNSSAAITAHLPSGTYQYVPKRGEGFPEDFIPFRDYDQAVNAKY
ncbi:hypothetical protein COO60DRAFT_1640292 [Scenedesmus sp. NREL 46B-D3]|nr:hypothetical protein COO60DRAFT_1640292 [Scenedesmus sp. NREL 46B-D3]